MILTSLWESEIQFILSNLVWTLLPIRCCFPALGMEQGPLQNSFDAYSEKFDLLLLSSHKGSAVNNHHGCWWFGEHVLYFTELTRGKTILSVSKARSAGWYPETGNLPLACQTCKRATQVVKIGDEWPDGKVLLLASLETVWSVALSPLLANLFAAVECVCRVMG